MTLSSINSISRREYYGRNYDEFLRLQAYYRILKSGKNAKKSSVEAREIVERSLTDPSFCAFVLRKIFKDHVKSTYAAIVKAFNWVKNKTGYDWTKEWVTAINAMDPRIENVKTGQVIRFASFDRPNSLAGAELESDNLYYGDLWFEEPMQISDMAKRPNHEEQQQEKHQFEIIESTLLRGQLPHKNAYRTVTFTFNDWSDGRHWILETFIKPFIKEDYRILDIYGKQLYYNPDFRNGKGIFVQVTSAGVNEFMDEKYKEFLINIRETDYEFYKAIGLGTRSTFMGNAYGGSANLSQIRRDIDLNRIERFAVGWDYASSKDKTAIVLIGINEKESEIQVVDSWTYHRGQVKNPVKEPELIAMMMEVIANWQRKFKFAVYEYRTKISGDSRDATVTAFLTQEFHKLPPHIKLDLMQPEPASKFNSSSSFIRVMATRWLIGSSKLHVASHLDEFMDELKMRTIEVDGKLRDGNDDLVQAFEYAWSSDIDRIIPWEYYQNFLSEQDKQRYEKRTLNEQYQILPAGL